MSASVSTEGPASSQEHPESGSASDARSQPAPDPEAEAKGTSVESCSGSRLKGEGGECAEDKPGERSGGHSALPGVRRVKVYQLDKESWTDLGTGYCHVHESKPAGQLRHQEQDLWESVDEGPDSGPWVAVTPEHTEQIGEFIWRTTIRAIMLLALTSGEEDPDEVLADASSAFGFHRQQDTLIVWTEPDGIDMALSFANVEACAQVWDLILHTKSLIYESNLSISLNDSSSSSDGGPPSSPQLFNSFSHTGHHQPSHFFSQPGTLPPPSFDNIHLVQQSLKWQVRTPSGREKLAAWFVKSNYAHALIALKTDAEDLESVDTLHMLCNILQTVLLINDNLIFDHIIQDDIFLGVAGILECQSPLSPAAAGLQS